MRNVCGVRQRIRTSLPKPKSFKKRNYKISELEKTDIKNIAKNFGNQSKQSSCSFACEEEYGFYRLAGRIVKAIFPR